MLKALRSKLAVKIIAGTYQADHGHILWKGKEVRPRNPREDLLGNGVVRIQLQQFLAGLGSLSHHLQAELEVSKRLKIGAIGAGGRRCASQVVQDTVKLQCVLNGRQFLPATGQLHHYYVQAGRVPFTSDYERRVGGTTWHWLGTAVRLVPNDFRLHSEYGVGVDWPLSYDDIEPWYEAAEQAIGVAGDDAEDNGAPRANGYPMPPFPLTYSDQKFAAAVESLGLRVTATPQARVSARTGYNGRPQCCGNAFCIPMCPIGAKYDATVHVNMATDAGAQLIHDAVVHRLETDADGTITSLIYRQPDGTDVTVTARRFVVAAHAIETPSTGAPSALTRTTTACPCACWSPRRPSGSRSASSPPYCRLRGSRSPASGSASPTRSMPRSSPG